MIYGFRWKISRENQSIQRVAGPMDTPKLSLFKKTDMTHNRDQLKRCTVGGQNLETTVFQKNGLNF